MKEKIILAFSGGLDTSFCIPYLNEKGFDVITVFGDSNLTDSEELKNIENKSKKLGAIKHYTVDIKDELFDDIISLIIKTNGLYEGSYPNLCADRYIIAKKCIEIAKKENAKYVAHGATAMGNDQVRFNLALKHFNPDITIIEPIKDIGGSREEEIKYLEKVGIEVSKKHKSYSINENMMGITYSGSEIDEDLEPNKNIFLLVNNKKINEEGYFDIGFEKGVPVSINGEKMSGSEIISYLNIELGKYGYGKEYYTGDCIVGIKGHIVIEAPALFFLIKAHKALEQYTQTKLQIENSAFISEKITNYMYGGQLFDKSFLDLSSFIKSNQENVTGNVKMKLEYGNALPVSVKSDFSLINDSIATYAQGCSWTKEDANGFIKLYGMQFKNNK